MHNFIFIFTFIINFIFNFTFTVFAEKIGEITYFVLIIGTVMKLIRIVK